MAIYGNMVVPSKAGGGLPKSSAGEQIYVPGQGVTARFSTEGARQAQAAGAIAAQGSRAAAQGFGDIGRGIGRLGGMFGAIEERNRRLDQAKAQESLTMLQNEFQEKEREWSRIKGANTANMEELKSRWWDEAMPRLTEGLGEHGKRYFNLHANRVGVMADTFIQSHQERETQAFQTQQTKLAMDAEANMLSLNPFDSASTAASLGRIRGLVEQEGLRKGWTPEMIEQAFRQAAGTAWGNAMAVQISQGNLEGANRLMAQYGSWLPADQRAKLTVSWNDSLRMQAAGLAQAGDVEGIRRLMQGAGARTLDQALEVGASATVGQKYTWGQNDCSGHTCQIWQAALADSPAKRAIFGADGEHRTAAEIMQRASEVTGHLYKGLEINESSVGGGWLLASAGQAHASGRFHSIGHIVTTFRKGDGSVWVSEALGGKTGQVQTMPLAQFLARYKGRALYGVNLSSMLASQGGGQQGAPGVPAGSRLAQVPTYTGVARVMAYHESGKEGSMHVSYGLPEKDGVDVGKYSFITGNAGGGPGGSVARFIKWAGTNGGDLGRLLFSGFNQLVGGNWAALNDAALWKSKGAALWKSIVQQNPAEFEKLEDAFALKGINAKIRTLSPDLQQAIENDKTGALREMAISTINQYGSGAKILQNQWNAHKHEGLESYIRNVYIDKSDTKYFQAFKDPYIGAKRAKREVEDILGLLRGGAGSAQAGQAPGMAMGQGFQMLPQTHQAIQTLELPAQANLLYQQALAGGGTPEEQQLRFMESLKPLPQGVQDKLRPYGERWFADMKQDRDTQGQIQYQQAWELLSKNKTRREQENLYTQLMQSDRLNDVAKSKLKSRWNEEQQVEKPEGQKWTAEMYGKIDEYWKDSAQASADIDRAIDAAAGSGAITDKQAQDLHEWNRSGGARKALVGDTGYLKQAYNQLLDPKVKKEKWKDVPPELLQRLWQRVKSNGSKAVTQDEIKAMLAEEMSVVYTEGTSLLGRIVNMANPGVMKPSIFGIFPGMMTSTNETRYWQAQTSGKGEKLVGLVPLPREYAKVAAEAAQHGYDPTDPKAVARYNLIRLNSQRRK